MRPNAIEPDTVEDVSAYGPMARDEEIERAVRLDRCRALARGVIELAWQDAHRSDVASVSVSKNARSFFLTEDAEFWSGAAGVDLRLLRRRLLDESRRT